MNTFKKAWGLILMLVGALVLFVLFLVNRWISSITDTPLAIIGGSLGFLLVLSGPIQLLLALNSWLRERQKRAKLTSVPCLACTSQRTSYKGMTFMGSKKYLCADCGFLNHTPVTAAYYVALIVFLLLNAVQVVRAMIENLEIVEIVPNPIGLIILVVILLNIVRYNRGAILREAMKHKAGIQNQGRGAPG